MAININRDLHYFEKKCVKMFGAFFFFVFLRRKCK